MADDPVEAGEPRCPVGDTLRAIRGDEAEHGWAVVAPVLDAWQRGDVPLEEYPVGSDGPSGKRRGEEGS